MIRIEGDGKLVRVFVDESDRWHHTPLYQAIVERVRTEGLAGATVVRGIEGFGATSRLHTTSILQLSTDLPVGSRSSTPPSASTASCRSSTRWWATAW